MFINKVVIDHVRNLEHVSLDDFQRFNVLIGDNGSGKTSFLEALAVAGQGRSFRTHKIGHVIQHQTPSLSVFIEAQDQHGLTHRIGIFRDKDNQFQVRVNGQSIYSLAELSQLLPLLVIDSEAFQLLDGTASIRMRFMDWGVFHVKHEFYEQWRIYQRALKQRNHLLKSGAKDPALFQVWDKQLADAGAILNSLRYEFLQDFYQYFVEYAKAFGSDFDGMQLRFCSGWDRSQHKIPGEPFTYTSESLQEKLAHNLESDSRYKRTQIGCHRADLILLIQQNAAREVLSRGQKKSLICALKMAMAKMLKESIDRTPVLLLDDLPAELDKNHLNAVVEMVREEGYQCFITSVNPLTGNNNMPLKARMFHVEHGKISGANGDINA